MADFSEWFDKNKDRLTPLLNSDAEQALFEAFVAGVNQVIDDYMAEDYALPEINNADK